MGFLGINLNRRRKKLMKQMMLQGIRGLNRKNGDFKEACIELELVNSNASLYVVGYIEGDNTILSLSKNSNYTFLYSGNERDYFN